MYNYEIVSFVAENPARCAKIAGVKRAEQWKTVNRQVIAAYAAMKIPYNKHEAEDSEMEILRRVRK